jgi:uncharacterized protein YabE (DUF348 family)
MYGLVLAGLLGGTAAWATGGKTVDLRIDGQDRQVHTSAKDVQGVLAAAHIAVSEHDLIAPDLATQIKDGGEIVVHRGHLLHLRVDGKARDVWVNADSVDEALGQLGYNTANLVSVSRSKRLDQSATSLSITSPKLVTFKVDGKSISVSTFAPTVVQAMAQTKIKLNRPDKVSPAGSSRVRNREVVTIKRVAHKLSVQQQSVPFQRIQQNDPYSLAGTSSVVTAGQTGLKQLTYQLLYVDGKLAGKVLFQTKVVRPVTNQLTKVGTKPKPAPVQAAAPVQQSYASSGSAQQIAAGMVSARGWGSDQFSCLVSLWNKESGWRTDAANSSGAYGIPQALPGSKMASAGSDWQTSASTQISWGLGYISGVYGTPCAAWAHSQATNWY